MMNQLKYFLFIALLFPVDLSAQQHHWASAFVKMNKDSSLTYIPDAQGNIFPDFSRVGYHSNEKVIPKVKVIKKLSATGENDQQKIQDAIGQLSAMPADKNGIRGALLLKAGEYKIPGSLRIAVGGIVLRGEGEQTKLIASGKGQRKLVIAAGEGELEELAGTRIRIITAYVPVGAKSFELSSVAHLKKGDKIVVFRPGTAKWIADLKMDQIPRGTGTRQWSAADYNLKFERVITAIKGKTIFIDQPVVMAMETKYGGGEIFRCAFSGRISEVGVENLSLESEYESETDEDHGWDAISFDKIENSWISNVTSRYFGYSCVNLGPDSKNITVSNSKCLAPKSQVVGGRRYSFNNDGQLNLVINCYASEGRHDYVTGAKVCGPNVFFNCIAENSKGDSGPHHRWAMGTLYDNITTDGEINIQDRGNWGTGHGWAGVNQILWNCKVLKAAVQSPYVSGQNYSIGLNGEKIQGRLNGRPDGIWEGHNMTGLTPASLYLLQVKNTQKYK